MSSELHVGGDTMFLNFLTFLFILSSERRLCSMIFTQKKTFLVLQMSAWTFSRRLCVQADNFLFYKQKIFQPADNFLFYKQIFFQPAVLADNFLFIE